VHAYLIPFGSDINLCFLHFNLKKNLILFSQMYSVLISSFFLILFNLTYEQAADTQAGSYEVREHSLNRPYPAGLFIIIFLIRIFNYLFI